MANEKAKCEVSKLCLACGLRLFVDEPCYIGLVHEKCHWQNKAEQDEACDHAAEADKEEFKQIIAGAHAEVKRLKAEKKAMANEKAKEQPEAGEFTKRLKVQFEKMKIDRYLLLFHVI